MNDILREQTWSLMSIGRCGGALTAKAGTVRQSAGALAPTSCRIQGRPLYGYNASKRSCMLLTVCFLLGAGLLAAAFRRSS